MSERNVRQQGKYEEYIQKTSEKAKESGSRLPYHLEYSRKIKEREQGNGK